MRRNQIGYPKKISKIVCGVQSLMIGVTTWLGRKSPTAALQLSTLLISSQLDCSPDNVNTVYASQPVPLTPGLIDYVSISYD